MIPFLDVLLFVFAAVVVGCVAAAITIYRKDRRP